MNNPACVSGLREAQHTRWSGTTSRMAAPAWAGDDTQVLLLLLPPLCCPGDDDDDDEEQSFWGSNLGSPQYNWSNFLIKIYWRTQTAQKDQFMTPT